MTTACDQKSALQLCVAKGHVRRAEEPASSMASSMVSSTGRVESSRLAMQAVHKPTAHSARVSGALRVLGATATHARNAQWLVSSQLVEVCQLNQHVKLLVNIYDEPRARMSPSLCLSYTYVRGHKPLFWKRALGPAVTAGFDFVWLFDADLVASGFPLQQMLIASTPARHH